MWTAKRAGLNADKVWNLEPVSYTHLDVYKRQPRELKSAFFNVGAKVDPADDQRLATLPKKQVQLEHEHMMQALLADRFNPVSYTHLLSAFRPARFAVHTETASANSNASAVQAP